ncbi:MAG: hypothetical protein WD887_01805 [Candidatus Saccharimonadales bacterium]
MTKQTETIGPEDEIATDLFLAARLQTEPVPSSALERLTHRKEELTEFSKHHRNIVGLGGAALGAGFGTAYLLSRRHH